MIKFCKFLFFDIFVQWNGLLRLLIYGDLAQTNKQSLMGNNVSLLKYALLIVLFCTSCVKEKDLYEPSGKNPDDTEELDLSLNSL